MLQLKLICILIISATSVLAKEELKCHTCKDPKVGCKSLDETTSEPCSEGTCTTIFDDKDPDIIFRGCSTELTAKCTEPNKNCFQCKSNNCNIAEKLTDYIDCIDCNSKDNLDCLHGTNTKTNKCYKDCLAQMVLDDTTKFYNLIRTCLDDLEKSKQTECQDSKMCKSCNDAKGSCNKEILPEKLLQCQTCNGVDECKKPVTKSCEKYNDDDQCFAIYSASNIESLGCVNSNAALTSDKIKELTEKNLIHLCKGNDCNKLESLPKRQECSLCNSRTDPKCAQKPSEMESKTMCDIEGAYGCYMRILPDNSTDRGCWKNVPEAEKTKCLDTAGNKLCSPCIDNLCNNKIFPANRRQCHVCDSSSPSDSSKDSSCSTNDPKKEEYCLNINDQCISILDNGITYRGCESDIKRKCNEQDRYCFKCSINNCNIVDFKNIIHDSGNSGMWQDLPLKCLTCNGDSCKTKLPEETCDRNIADCMTVFNDEKVVIARGCENKVYESYLVHCHSNPELCFNCKSDNCNSVTSVTDYVSCTYCGWPNSPSCNEIDSSSTTTYPKRQCNKSCMTALYNNFDETEEPAYNLIRTCTDDKLPEQQKNCTTSIDEENTLCLTCTGENCNKEIYPKNRTNCFMCDNVKDCATPKSQKCPLYRNNDECYYIYNNEQVVEKSGCKSSLTKTVIDDLLNKNKIGLCNGKDCNSVDNKPKDNECVLCNSKTNIECATKPHEINTTATCKAPNSKCFVKVDEDGFTQRGCLASLQSEMSKCNSTSDTCKSCDTTVQCNEIFPANRRQCHVCDSSKDSSCSTNDPKKEEICYNINDQCISILDNGITYRGCQSDINRKCNEQDRYCFKCSINNCNIVDFKNIIHDSGNSGLWQDLPLKCLTCNGDSCKTKLPEETCDRNIADCMTVFNDEKVVIARGCENKVYESYLVHCHSNPELCFNCKSDNCNSVTSVTDYVSCTYCGWPNSPSCNEIDSSSTTTYAKRQCNKSCMTALYNHFDETEEPAYNLIRTCTDDKLPEQQKNCTTSIDEENTLCLTCTGANCNKEIYPKNRSNCFMCDNAKDCDKPNSQKCPLYRNNDECYYIYNNEQVVEKSGCKSSLKKTVIDDLLNKNKIGLCNGKDCNSVDNKPKDNDCVLCDSKTHIECATKSHEINTTATCKAPNSKCFVKVDEDGFTQRGCLASLQSEMSKCNSTSDTCKSCNTTVPCNEKFPENRRSCQVCNSKDEKKCHDEPNFIQICPQYLPDEKCVSIYKSKETIRGCGQLVKCETPSTNKTCQICPIDDCNTVDLKKINSGPAIIGNIMMISLLSFGLITFFK